MAEFEITAKVKPEIDQREKRKVQNELDTMGSSFGVSGGTGVTDDLTAEISEGFDRTVDELETIKKILGAQAGTLDTVRDAISSAKFGLSEGRRRGGGGNFKFRRDFESIPEQTGIAVGKTIGKIQKGIGDFLTGGLSSMERLRGDERGMGNMSNPIGRFTQSISQFVTEKFGKAGGASDEAVNEAVRRTEVQEQMLDSFNDIREDQRGMLFNPVASIATIAGGMLEKVKEFTESSEDRNDLLRRIQATLLLRGGGGGGFGGRVPVPTGGGGGGFFSKLLKAGGIASIGALPIFAEEGGEELVRSQTDDQTASVLKELDKILDVTTADGFSLGAQAGFVGGQKIAQFLGLGKGGGKKGVGPQGLKPNLDRRVPKRFQFGGDPFENVEFRDQNKVTLFLSPEARAGLTAFEAFDPTFKFEVPQALRSLSSVLRPITQGGFNNFLDSIGIDIPSVEVNNEVRPQVELDPDELANRVEDSVQDEVDRRIDDFERTFGVGV